MLLFFFMRHDDTAFRGDAVPLLRELRQHRDFRLFWFGESISLIGSQVTSLALPLLALQLLGASDEQVGLLRFLQLVPYLALAVFVGVWADRVRRRPVMLTANVARLGLIGLVPALHWIDQLTLSRLLVITLAIGVASVFFDVTWMSYVPALVGDSRHLVEANSKLSMSSSAADVAGPGLGGLLLSFLAAPIVLLLDAITYAVAVLALARVRVREPLPTRKPKRNATAEMREGLHVVFGSPVLRALALIGACCNFSMVSVWTIFLIYGARDVGLSSATIGGVFAVASVGGVLGAAAAGRILATFPLGRVYVVAQSVLLLGPWLIVAGSSGGVVATTTWSAISFFATYLGLGIAGVIIVSLRQATTPPAAMARMTAVFRTLLFGGGALGGLAAGLLTGQVGGRSALSLVAIGSSVAAVAVWLAPVKHVNELPLAA